MALLPVCFHFRRRTFLTTLYFPRTSVTCLFSFFNPVVSRVYLFKSKLSRCTRQQAPTVLFLDPTSYIPSPDSVPTHSLPSPSLHAPQHGSQQSCPTFRVPLRWISSCTICQLCWQSALGTYIRNPRYCRSGRWMSFFKQFWFISI